MMSLRVSTIQFAFFCLITLGQLFTHHAYAQHALNLYNKPIIADISKDKIEIHARFDGEDLLLYGARNAPGQIIAVVTGPYANVVLSRKDNVGGMWMQVEREKLSNIPLYFVTASTKEISSILPASIIEQLALSYPNIHAQTNDVMAQALSEKLVDRGWLQPKSIPIQYLGETLFRVKLPFANNIPRGRYTVDVFLVDNGTITASQTLPLEAVKIGLDSWLYDNAHKHPWWYGAVAILLSLTGGWLGNRLVKRR